MEASRATWTTSSTRSGSGSTSRSAAAPAADAGVVQSVSGVDRGRPRAKWSNPRRAGTAGVDGATGPRMGGASVMRAEVDYADIQGIVRFGYGKMTEAAYVLVHIKNALAARTWLRTAPISNAVALPAAPPTALQIAFTAPGLATLGVSRNVIAGFSREFVDGMTEQNRLRRSGDIGANAPARWDWGGDGSNGSAGVPHAVVMFFAERGAEGGGGIAAFMKRLMGPSWTDAFDVLRTLKTANLDGVEPFGFADGISQPEVDWKRQREAAQKQIGYNNAIAIGEVLLGYPNEYGKYTDRPLLDVDAASETLLPAEDVPSRRDLAR